MAKLSDIDILKIGNTINMTGAIFSGEGKTFLCHFPDDQTPAVGVDDFPLLERLDMDLGDWEKFLRQTDLLEVEVLAKASDGTLAKAILRKSNRQIDQVVSWRVFKRDEYSCRYCGRDDVPLTVDHLVCWEEGGPSSEANMVSACKKCNKVRGNTKYAEWLQHPHYKNVSKNLNEERRRRNHELADTLAAVPRHTHIKSR